MLTDADCHNATCPPEVKRRAEFMVQRRALMDRWATYLDQLRLGAQVLPFKAP